MSAFNRLLTLTATFCHHTKAKLFCIVAVILFSLTCSVSQAALGDNQGGSFGQSDFLTVDEAFQLDVDVMDGTLWVNATIAPEYYLYQHRFKFSPNNASLGKPLFPPAKPKYDEAFGDTKVYYQQVSIPIAISSAAESWSVEITYQGCAEKGLCYPPETKTFSFPKKSALALLPSSSTPNNSPSSPNNGSGVDLTNASAIASMLTNQSLWLILGIFFVAGIGLALTPCVFPMYPILSGIVAGQKDKSTQHAFWLSMSYIQGAAIAYALLGALFAYLGNGIQADFQAPWIRWATFGLFIALALSMFDVYHIQLPSFMRQKIDQLNQKQRGGSYVGVAMMGVLSTVVVSPCTTAPLAGALIYISQSGNVLTGALALYALGLGIGLPLLTIGTSAGKIMPRSGAWMNSVKTILGFAMIAVGWSLVGDLVPHQVYLVGWASILFAAVLMLSGKGILRPWVKLGWHGMRSAVAGMAILFLYTAYVGASSPLNLLADKDNTPELAFENVETVAALEAALAKAAAQGKPAMLDLYADWCVACKEFDHITFADAGVQTHLGDFTLLRADLTANDADDKALMQALDIVGLPTILFYPPDTDEDPTQRVTGFLGPQAFIQHLKDL
ncbi:MAG: protein-disulfide reductase DsbD [Kangiellaceae bacterium]|nr:protein-disulfide reductase DsbD [Kangiellaceae bacterium]|tara:strand:- start:955 stop:2799 length:1845 start_codon:yes stop_codon:yes gene_type:complete